MRNSTSVGFFVAIVLAVAIPVQLFAEEAMPTASVSPVTFGGPIISAERVVANIGTSGQLETSLDIQNQGTHTGTYRMIVEFHPVPKSPTTPTTALFTAFSKKDIVLAPGAKVTITETTAVPPSIGGDTRVFLGIVDMRIGQVVAKAYAGNYSFKKGGYVEIKRCAIDGKMSDMVTPLTIDATPATITCEGSYVGGGERIAHVSVVSRHGVTGTTPGKMIDAKYITLNEKVKPIKFTLAGLSAGLSWIEVSAVDEQGAVLGYTSAIPVHIAGDWAEITDIGSDKLSYVLGETAKVLPRVRMFASSDYRIDVTLSSGKKMCAEKMVGAILSEGGTINIPITRNCPDPIVTVELVSNTGVVVASLSKRLQGDISHEGNFSGKNILQLLAILGFLMFTPILIIYVKRYGKKAATAVTVLIVLVGAVVPLAVRANPAYSKMWHIYLSDAVTTCVTPMLPTLTDLAWGIITPPDVSFGPGATVDPLWIQVDDISGLLGYPTHAEFSYSIPDGTGTFSGNIVPPGTNGSWTYGPFTLTAPNTFGDVLAGGYLRMEPPIDNQLYGYPLPGTAQWTALNCPVAYSTVDQVNQTVYVVAQVTPPSAPTLSPVTQTVLVNENASFTASGFNIPGSLAVYEFDWNMDGVPNYVSPQVTDSGNAVAVNSWAVSGVYDIQARICFVPSAVCSGWTVLNNAVNVNDPVTPANSQPNPPTFSGAQLPYTGIAYDYFLFGTDPDAGERIRIEVDWNGDSTVDQYVPTAVTYMLAGGIGLPRTHIWSSAGSFSARARSCDDGGLCSAWTTLAVTAVAGPACFVHEKPSGTAFVTPQPEYVDFWTNFNDPTMDLLGWDPGFGPYGLAACSGADGWCTPYFEFIGTSIPGDVGRPPLPPGCESNNTQKPVINTFTASPNPVVSGNPTTLSWNVGGFPPTCTIDQGVGNAPTPNGSKSSGNLFADTTFTMTCQNPWGTATANVTVTVGPSTIPMLATPAVSAVTTTGATLGATLVSDGGSLISARGTCWGTTPSPITNCTNEGANAIGAFSHAIAGMTPNTNYYFRGFAVNGMGTGYSVDGTFTTRALPPIITTNPATLITTTGATLNGSANPNGVNATGWFRYSTTNPGACNDTFGTRAPLASGSALGLGVVSIPYSLALTGLTPGNTYYFCAIAGNTGGTSFGTLQSFTTGNPPTVTVNPAQQNVASAGVWTVTMSASPDATYCMYDRTGDFPNNWMQEPVPGAMPNTTYTTGPQAWIGPGTVTYTFRCQDGGGTWSADQSATVVIGAPAPAANLYSLPGNPYSMTAYFLSSALSLPAETIQMQNIGDAGSSFTVNGVSVSGAGYSCASGCTTPTLVTPTSPLTIQIRFTPPGISDPAYSYFGTLTVETDLGNYTLNLQGKGMDPMWPAPLSFIKISVGSTTEGILPVTNNAPDPIDVGYLMGVTPPFQCVNGPDCSAAGHIIIPPGGANIPIRFSPSSAEYFIIHPQFSTSPTTQITIEGYGAAKVKYCESDSEGCTP